MADTRTYALVFFTVAVNKERQGVGSAVYAVEEGRLKVVVESGNDEYGTRAIIGVAVAALV